MSKAEIVVLKDVGSKKFFYFMLKSGSKIYKRTGVKSIPTLDIVTIK